MISIVADETTDHRDRSVLNILARIGNKVFIIDVLFLEACNHQTLSQLIIKCVTTYGVQYKGLPRCVIGCIHGVTPHSVSGTCD